MNFKSAFSMQMSRNKAHNMKYRLLFISFYIHTSAAMPSQQLLNEDIDQVKDIAKIIMSNIYEPKKSDIAKDSDDDTTMLISKLSDDELISLLQKKQSRDIIDVIDTINIGKTGKKSSKARPRYTKKTKKSSPQALSDHGSAFFRIDNKEVEPFNIKFGVEPGYLAHQRIKNLLHSVPPQSLADESSEETEENKEILFDLLTAQLKKLCCKSSKNKQKKVHLPSYEPLLSISNSDKNQLTNPFQYEQMFLIVNEEIESTEGSGIIHVDPNSLSKNSTAILLGPITAPLSDSELHVVMNRITSELSKPEYIPLFQEVSEGKVIENTRLMKSLVSGSNTRRYIKPHRCNQRYPLSQGPKWLVCTGYLNINTPSLYD